MNKTQWVALFVIPSTILAMVLAPQSWSPDERACLCFGTGLAAAALGFLCWHIQEENKRGAQRGSPYRGRSFEIDIDIGSDDDGDD